MLLGYILFKIFSCTSLYPTQFLRGKLTFYGRILKSVAFVARTHSSRRDKNRVFSTPLEQTK
jgi:hypothetical protein